MPDVFVAPTTTEEQPKNLPIKNAALVVNPIPQVLSSHEIPIGITFDTQEPGEYILLFLRRDFITNVPWIATAILLIVGPPIISILIAITNTSFPTISPRFLFFLALFYYLGVLVYIFVNYIVWYYNVSIITNERVIDVDFQGLIYKNVAVTKIGRIADVSFSQIGSIRTIFDYGDVLIQTESYQEKFSLQAIPNPSHVVEIIQALIHNEEV